MRADNTAAWGNFFRWWNILHLNCDMGTHFFFFLSFFFFSPYGFWTQGLMLARPSIMWATSPAFLCFNYFSFCGITCFLPTANVHCDLPTYSLSHSWNHRCALPHTSLLIVLGGGVSLTFFPRLASNSILPNLCLPSLSNWNYRCKPSCMVLVRQYLCTNQNAN
jgi:hypothetical protein